MELAMFMGALTVFGVIAACVFLVAEANQERGS